MHSNLIYGIEIPDDTNAEEIINQEVIFENTENGNFWKGQQSSLYSAFS